MPWQALTQPSTTMGHALETVARCKVLIEHPDLTTVQGKYSYRIERKGDESIYSVTDGTNDNHSADSLGRGRQFGHRARPISWRRMASCMKAE